MEPGYYHCHNVTCAMARGAAMRAPWLRPVDPTAAIDAGASVWSARGDLQLEHDVMLALPLVMSIRQGAVHDLDRVGGAMRKVVLIRSGADWQQRSPHERSRRRPLISSYRSFEGQQGRDGRSRELYTSAADQNQRHANRCQAERKSDNDRPGAEAENCGNGDESDENPANRAAVLQAGQTCRGGSAAQHVEKQPAHLPSVGQRASQQNAAR